MTRGPLDSSCSATSVAGWSRPLHTLPRTDPHRKIAWLCALDHDIKIAEATCLRILREAGLMLPQDYVREVRDLAGARREAFLHPPTRRNQVWQMDFFELETAGGGTWRSGD
ncbi:MAG: hypothetical protein M0P31_08455, partial [Solirubrobacteraceae bacterium]|nr:hypothetical protein [Solirubrobacteraceae bacterium]